MKSIDTNVLVRFVLADESSPAEKAQYQASIRVLANGPLFILDSVVLESVWVLSKVYRLSAEQYVRELSDIAGLPNVTLENPARVAAAFQWHLEGMDFADALHLAGSGLCDELVTFDKGFIAAAKAKTACRVIEPA